MDIRENVSLRDYSTMRLGGAAHRLVTVRTDNDLKAAVDYAAQEGLGFVVIGSGSNIIWSDAGFDGLVIVNALMGITKSGEDELSATYTVGAGENWDEFVAKTTNERLSGIESLSLIPGTVGAAPVQNIGAYGQEAKESIVEVYAYDSHDHEFVTLKNDQCDFRYRKSIFNDQEKGRYAIALVTFKLSKSHPQPPYYRDVDAYLEEHNIVDPTSAQVRDAVVAIRQMKLPDVASIANNGSFFHNPVIDQAQASELSRQFPNMPQWETGDGRVKISAAWLIEEAGFHKGYQDTETGMALWKNQALVFVNEQAKSTRDLLTFRDHISRAIHDKFGIKLQQEPELI